MVSTKVSHIGSPSSMIAAVVAVGSMAFSTLLLLFGLTGLQGMSGDESFATLLQFFPPVYGVSMGIFGVGIGIVSIAVGNQGFVRGLLLGFGSFAGGGLVGGVFGASAVMAFPALEPFFRSLTGRGPTGVFLLLFVALSIFIGVVSGGAFFWYFALRR